MLELFVRYYNRYFIEKTNDTFVQFFRYIFVGGFSALVDIGLLFILNNKFGINYLVAAALAFLAGLTVNYLLSVTWIFHSTGKIKKEFTIFSMIGIAGLIWTEIIMWFFVEKIDLSVMYSKIIALILVLFWNFIMRKKFAFK